MKDLDRRQFLLVAGKWIALAGLAGASPALSACGRALSSETETSTAESEASTTSPSETTASTVATSSSTAVSATATTLPATSSTKSVSPDLAVITGDDPAANVRAAMAMMGGMERFVKKGAKVVVKPNVLNGQKPETATTTNPDVMSAVIKMCFEAGAGSVTVFDNPTVAARPAFEVSGLDKAASAAGATMKYLSNRDFRTYKIPEGKLLTEWPLVADALEADVFINVPIAKTHSVTKLTMSMKNLMGIMGGSRGQIHYQIDTKLVDLNTLVKPHLVVLDAYRVLFRNGPTGGNPADVKLAKTVVIGTNQASIDAYGCSFFDMQPADVPHIKEAGERGIGEIDVSKLTIQKGTA